MPLIQIAFYFFAAIAAGGIGMAAMIAFGIRIPSFLGPAHGLGGLAALATLFTSNLKGGDATPTLAWWALVVFLGGFIGGMLLFRVLFKGRTPLAMVAVHGSAGALGLYLLYNAAF
ncbi:hypothetical protein [Nevskia ramosa]|uniref:hypothetical protein n=1 Tax=Nevskia ramosa TaxID=64002 RepID=UPI0023534BE7|nr:hypothetical protein [Nevskia ramosa]